MIMEKRVQAVQAVQNVQDDEARSISGAGQ
jgi:hypothetical protein